MPLSLDLKKRKEVKKAFKKKIVNNSKKKKI